MRTLLAVAVILVGALAAAANSSYDIRSYDLVIEPDFGAKTLRLRAGVEIANPNLARSFEFYLSDSYTDVRVSANGKPIPLERKDGVITVRPQKATQRVRLSFECSGPAGRGRDENRSVIEPESLFLLWSDRWYPIDFEDWATVRTTVTLPRGFQAIAPGKLVSAKPQGEKVRYIFQTAHPAVTFSVFADSRWRRTERTIGGIRFVTLLHPESQQHAERIFTTSSDVVGYYSQLYGGYPFEQFSFVTITGMYARRAFNGWVGYTPQYLDKEMARTGYDAHETALLWWGLTSRGSGPGAWQWTEGFGDYAEFQYAEARSKPLAEIFIRSRDKYLATPPDKDLHYTELKGNTPQELVHGKYPWIMHALRTEIGDAAFERGGRELFSRFRHRTFTMDEFIATFETASGKSLKTWRETWLESRGKPPIVPLAIPEKMRRDLQAPAAATAQ